jgi:hypothetical protein
MVQWTGGRALGHRSIGFKLDIHSRVPPSVVRPVGGRSEPGPCDGPGVARARRVPPSSTPTKGRYNSSRRGRTHREEQRGWPAIVGPGLWPVRGRGPPSGQSRVCVLPRLRPGLGPRGHGPDRFARHAAIRPSADRPVGLRRGGTRAMIPPPRTGRVGRPRRLGSEGSAGHGRPSPGGPAPYCSSDRRRASP